MPKEHEDVETTLGQGTTPDASQQKRKWHAIDWIVGATFGLELLLIIGWSIAQVTGWNPDISSEHFAQFYFAWGLGFLSLGYIVLILWPIFKKDNDTRWFHSRILSSGIVGGSYAFLLPVVMSLPEGSVNSGGAAALRQAILLATGGLIGLIALGETRRKNDNDREAAESLRIHQQGTLIQQKEQFEKQLEKQQEQFEANAFKDRKAERRERYTKAVEQLGDEKAPIRMGGVYTLVGLVDEWLEEDKLSEDERIKEGQVIINSLCAYIRSPFTLASHYDEPSQDTPTSEGTYKDREQEFYAEKAILDSEADVRLGIIKEIHNRLQGTEEILWGTWSSFEYNFSGSTFFYPVDLSGSYYLKSVNFSGSTYQNTADFSDSTYQNTASFGGSTYQRWANFSDSIYQGWISFGGSIYQGSTYFVGSTYQGLTNFGDSIYKSSTDFSDSTYQSSANFGGSTYVGKANFSNSIYKGEVDLSGSIYQEEANFQSSTYKTQALFTRSTYTGSASFSISNYQNIANFSKSTYRDEADYQGSIYLGLANFSDSTYAGKANFSDSTYQDEAYFSDSDYLGSANFSLSIYNRQADFIGSTYKNEVYFNGSTYRSTADFIGSIYQDSADFNGSIYQDSANFYNSTYKGWVAFDDSIYKGWTDFSNSTYNEKIDFSNSTYEGVTNFSGSGYRGSAKFCNSIYQSGVSFDDSTYESWVDFSGADYLDWAFFSNSIYQSSANFSRSTYSKQTDFRNSTYEGMADFSGSIFYQKTYFGKNEYNVTYSNFIHSTPQFYNEKSHQNTLFGSSDNDFTVDINEGYPINLNSEGIPLNCKLLTPSQMEYLKGKLQAIEKTNNGLLEVKDPKEKAKHSKNLRSLNKELHEWREEATTVKIKDVAAEDTES
ncbi:hypothetical protein CRM92_05070 [Rothia dentocariosa]|jgi:hypothetical protein|uniref:Pentapeptide repeat-containing protein n=1 Tax=Rothia dentocariosa TaxID=2047 RepID=A0A2A8D914_9MICC|nr:hypothetical protein [Rothia dentocariosa]PEN17374.1 hypothetical protein CRM92_05070 [Rothia dentocariosa]